MHPTCKWGDGIELLGPKLAEIAAIVRVDVTILYYDSAASISSYDIEHRREQGPTTAADDKILPILIARWVKNQPMSVGIRPGIQTSPPPLKNSNVAFVRLGTKSRLDNGTLCLLVGLTIFLRQGFRSLLEVGHHTNEV